jgi:hypothetical protein
MDGKARTQGRVSHSVLPEPPCSKPTAAEHETNRDAREKANHGALGRIACEIDSAEGASDETLKPATGWHVNGQRQPWPSDRQSVFSINYNDVRQRVIDWQHIHG